MDYKLILISMQKDQVLAIKTVKAEEIVLMDKI
jgi:hypothetical protein